MEIESSDGSRTVIKSGSEIEFGRGLGFKIDDRTVSRRHVSFQLNPLEETRARFVVIGKNPIWVHTSKSGQVSTFRTSESGEMEIGDMFCVSAKNPIWFALKRAEFEGEKENNVKRELGLENELAESLESSCEINDVGLLQPEAIDLSHVDPVKEFGFLVIGQEFANYPKKMVRDIKNWDWFIEEPRVDSEDESDEKRKEAVRGKRKKRGENEDDEWTGESEEEKEQLTKTKKVQRPKYLTRSIDRHKRSKDKGKNVHPLQKKNTKSSVKSIDDEEADEDDETLGGFIVDNDDLEQEEEIDDEDEEEDEFDEDDHDDELDDQSLMVV